MVRNVISINVWTYEHFCLFLYLFSLPLFLWCPFASQSYFNIRCCGRFLRVQKQRDIADIAIQVVYEGLKCWKTQTVGCSRGTTTPFNRSIKWKSGYIQSPVPYLVLWTFQSLNGNLVRGDMEIYCVYKCTNWDNIGWVWPVLSSQVHHRSIMKWTWYMIQNYWFEKQLQLLLLFLFSTRINNYEE